MSIGTENAGMVVVTGDAEPTNLVFGILKTRVGAGDVSVPGRVSSGGRVFVEAGSIDVRLPPESDEKPYLEPRVGEVSRDEGEQGLGEG